MKKVSFIFDDLGQLVVSYSNPVTRKFEKIAFSPYNAEYVYNSYYLKNDEYLSSFYEAIDIVNGMKKVVDKYILNLEDENGNK